MKKLLLPAMLATALVGCGQAEQEDEGVILSTIEQKASYGFGRQVGEQMMQVKSSQDVDVDLDAVIAGIRDTFSGTQSRLTEEEIGAAFTELQHRAQAKVEEANQAAKKVADDFLAENAKKDGVIEVEPGLQYQVLSSGSGGDKPKPEDTVKTHYHGTLIDGTVFDSSVDRGEPISFPVGGVIPGWTKALQLMSVGDKWKLFIHPDLAYGERAAGSIPPNSLLIFEVELLGINEEEGE